MLKSKVIFAFSLKRFLENFYIEGAATVCQVSNKIKHFRPDWHLSGKQKWDALRAESAFLGWWLAPNSGTLWKERNIAKKITQTFKWFLPL